MTLLLRLDDSRLNSLSAPKGALHKLSVIPGIGGAESPESMNTGLWKNGFRALACGVAPE
jgi:hypothetical protein